MTIRAGFAARSVGRLIRLGTSDETGCEILGKAGS
jgi:hypothetical protein